MRRLHRWISIVAAVLILYVSVTGFVMVFDNLWLSFNMARMGGGGPSPALLKIFENDGTVEDANLPGMLQSTLSAVDSHGPMPRVIRLREYGGMPQGVLVTGDRNAEQIVIDARNGKSVGLYEPGYPRTPMFPFQWNAHETWKKLHRGDFFGLGGRWLDLASGLALLFLSISGLVMYAQIYRARGRTGRRAIFWK